jgi:guanosine-3',5'-bis(diphosphate) 3'-pyrophosphohydrolase
MPEHVESTYRPLLEAFSFAARAHQGQVRKDGRTPYFAHVARVCLVLRHVFGVEDREVLQAAVLHDVIEDTTTDYDDLVERFGPDVAGWAAALSKDKRLPEAEREAAYAAGLGRGPWQVKICKLADVFDNLMDTLHMQPPQRAKAFRNARRYLDAVRADSPPVLQEALRMVEQLLVEREAASV